MNRWTTMLAFALALNWATTLARAHETDAGQIEYALKHQFDRPESPLKVAPVAVVGEHAVAGRTQDGRGGRALLRKDKAGWSISLCAGDGLLQAKVLESAGIPAVQAVQLAKAVAAAEASLSPEKLKRFASFEGMVKMAPGQAHPPASHSGHMGNDPTNKH